MNWRRVHLRCNSETYHLLLASFLCVLFAGACHASDEHIKSKLDTAIILSDYEAAALLVNKTNLNEKIGDSQLYPLQSAIIMRPTTKDDRIVRLLVEHGADMELVNEKGLTSLHFAAMVGAADVTEFLLSNGAAPDKQTIDGFTPLMIAVQNINGGFGSGNPQVNYRQTIVALLKARASILLRNKQGQTALDIATDRKDQNAVELLTGKMKE